MPVNPDFAGRTFPPSEPYEVSRVKIAEFAQAIGDLSPLCRDRAAAQAAGYPDVIAPPTFAIVITMASSGHAIADDELGLDYSMVVHGEQRFEHARPLHAGDVVVAQTTITDITPRRTMTMLTTRTEITTTGGEHVCTALSTLVERGA
ncbi:MAG: MaoC family dehydratase N-terminal domain-containing protein [Actinobacteria bacterium]|nr:MaoC family dehydratase N-terminal domain-containing protein [Actinomycetota bacterium]